MAQTTIKGEKNAIALDDIQNLIGKWKGTLTYIDYNANKPYSMPCELEIKPKKKHKKLFLYYTYPNEPQANNKSKLKISKNKLKIDGKSIISRTKQADGTIQIITAYSAKDGNDKKKALIRNIYIIGAEKLIIKKEIQFEGTDDWFKRNEYNFNKK